MAKRTTVAALLAAVVILALVLLVPRLPLTSPSFASGRGDHARGLGLSALRAQATKQAIVQEEKAFRDFLMNWDLPGSQAQIRELEAASSSTSSPSTITAVKMKEEPRRRKDPVVEEKAFKDFLMNWGRKPKQLPLFAGFEQQAAESVVTFSKIFDSKKLTDMAKETAMNPSIWLRIAGAAVLLSSFMSAASNVAVLQQARRAETAAQKQTIVLNAGRTQQKQTGKAQQQKKEKEQRGAVRNAALTPIAQEEVTSVGSAVLRASEVTARGLLQFGAFGLDLVADNLPQIGDVTKRVAQAALPLAKAGAQAGADATRQLADKLGQELRTQVPDNNAVALEAVPSVFQAVATGLDLTANSLEQGIAAASYVGAVGEPVAEAALRFTSGLARDIAAIEDEQVVDTLEEVGVRTQALRGQAEGLFATLSKQADSWIKDISSRRTAP